MWVEEARSNAGAAARERYAGLGSWCRQLCRVAAAQAPGKTPGDTNAPAVAAPNEGASASVDEDLNSAEADTKADPGAACTADGGPSDVAGSRDVHMSDGGAVQMAEECAPPEESVAGPLVGPGSPRRLFVLRPNPQISR